jgi:hypothetical protein
MKYGLEMGSVPMMYIPSFIKISSGIQKLIWEIHRKEIAEAYFRKVGQYM